MKFNTTFIAPQAAGKILALIYQEHGPFSNPEDLIYGPNDHIQIDDHNDIHMHRVPASSVEKAAPLWELKFRTGISDNTKRRAEATVLHATVLFPQYFQLVS